MVPDDSSSEAAPDDAASTGNARTPAKRKRLQQCFEHASKQMARESHDYATDLFAQCVLGDPSNLIYVQSYVGNLKKKYNNNKTGGKLAQLEERGARSAIKKAISKGQWDEAIKHGLKVLAVNPWDTSILLAMATAAANAGDDDVEPFYLKSALEANPKDPGVNRNCALALAARYEFDQAIACWFRVQQAKPGDEEAQRAIADLTVEKTIKKGGYEDEDLSKKLRGEAASAGPADVPQRAMSAEGQLQQKIDASPKELSPYRDLAQLHISDENYKAAEEVYAKALQALKDNEEVRELFEDAQLRHMRQQVKTAEDDATRKQLRQELLEKELAACKNQCRRYPNNLAFRYKLGHLYQLNGAYKDGIREYQSARNDSRYTGVCMYRLGQCFQQIKQHRLAMNHYEEAIQQIPDRDTENRKEALYHAGRLALALKDVDTAEKHLGTLAGLDFAFKDVSTLLDKVAALRENE